MRGDAAWRARGHAPGMPSACPRRAAAKAKAAPMGRQPRHGHAAAKAWACSSQGQGSPPWASTQGLGMHAGSPPWARSQGMGMQQPRPRQPPMGTQQARPGRARSSQGLGEHAAAKAWACTQQPRPGRACVGALACPWAQAAGPLGARRVPEGQWQHGEGVACPVGGMPRPWHALGTPRRPWQHLGGLLLPSLDSLFGHLPTLPPLKSA
jgi:hypothetical protein